MLPWIVILGLLALKPNRCGKAWWIWAPLGVWMIGWTLLALNISPDSERGELFLQMLKGVVTGIACVWLLGETLGRWNRFVNLVSAGFCIFAMGLLMYWPTVETLASFYNRDEDTIATLVLWLASVFVFASAFGITMLISRRQYRPFRVGLGVFLGLLLGWLLAALVLGAVASSFEVLHSFRFRQEELTIWVIGAAIVSLILLLPFLILSFTNSFYRERLRSWLGLEAKITKTPPLITPVEQVR